MASWIITRAVESCQVSMRLAPGNGGVTANMLEQSLQPTDLTKRIPFQNATQLPFPLKKGKGWGQLLLSHHTGSIPSLFPPFNTS